MEKENSVQQTVAFGAPLVAEDGFLSPIKSANTTVPVASPVCEKAIHAALPPSPACESPLQVSITPLPVTSSPPAASSSTANTALPKITASPVSMLLSPPRSISGQRVFASPLKFQTTPPPPAPLSAHLNAELSSSVSAPDLASAVAASAEDEEELQKSFALCAAAKELLDAAQEQKRSDEQELSQLPPTTTEELIPSIVERPSSASLEENEVEVVEAEEAPVADQSNVEDVDQLIDAVVDGTADAEHAVEAEAEVEEEPFSVEDVESDLGADSNLLEAEPAVEKAEQLAEEDDGMMMDESANAAPAIVVNEAVETCTNVNCLALLDLSENLSLEVSELTNRYDNLQEEGARLFKQYEIKCAMLKATKAHNQSQQEYITTITAEHEQLRAEYQELYHAYSELENLYNTQAANMINDGQTQSAHLEVLLQKEEENLALKQQLAALESRVQQMESTYSKDAVSKASEMDAKMAALTSELSASQSTMDELKQSLEQQTSLRREVEQKLAASVSSELEVRQQLASVSEMLQSSSKQMVLVLAERDAALKQAVEEKERSNSSVEASKTEWEMKLQAAKEEVESLRNESSNERTALTEQLSAVQADFETCRGELASVQASFEQAQNDNKNLAAQVAEMEKSFVAQHEEQIVEISRAAEEADRIVKKLENEKSQVETNWQEAENRVEALNKEVAAHVETINSLTRGRDSALTEASVVPSLKQEIATQSKALARAETLQASLEQSLKDALAQHSYDLKCSAGVAAELEGEIASLKTELEERIRKHKESKKKAEELKAEVERLQTTAVASTVAVSNKEAAAAPLLLQANQELSAEVEKLTDELLKSRSENATLEGRLTATRELASGETIKLRGRVSQLELELDSVRRIASATAISSAHAQEISQLRAALVNAQSDTAAAVEEARVQSVMPLQQALESKSKELEQLKADKEMLLQQMELLVESGGAGNGNNGVDSAAEIEKLRQDISTLQQHNADLKAYMTRYKKSGDEKMGAQLADYQKLMAQVGAVVKVVAEMGLVRKENSELYAAVQAIAHTNKAKQQQAALAAANAAHKQ